MIRATIALLMLVLASSTGCTATSVGSFQRHAAEPVTASYTEPVGLLFTDDFYNFAPACCSVDAGEAAMFPALPDLVETEVLDGALESDALSLKGLGSANEFVADPADAIVTRAFMESAIPMAIAPIAPTGTAFGQDNLAIPEPSSGAMFTTLAAGWLLKRRRR